MTDAVLAVQKALRKRLVTDSGVIALVPAASILDRNARPAPDPSIILGEDQVVGTDILIDRSVVRVHSTLHIWKTEEGLTGVKAIAGAIWKAMKGRRPILEGFTCCDLRLSDARFMRDPEGAMGHGVVFMETLVRELREGEF